MADLWSEMVATARGQPRLPEVVPSAQTSYTAMSTSEYGLGYTRLQTVFNYLRRGTQLEIPLEWSHLIPKPS